MTVIDRMRLERRVFWHNAVGAGGLRARVKIPCAMLSVLIEHAVIGARQLEALEDYQTSERVVDISHRGPRYATVYRGPNFYVPKFSCPQFLPISIVKSSRTIYINEDWLRFSERIKRRDEYRCLQCARSRTDVILQVHHKIYIPGKAPWEYALSDCLTLCKGCHAREHGLIEPDRGWTLLSIDDLGAQDGVCERNGCGAEIRYEHWTYHPKWGYMVVGSTCIEHLTQEDRLISNNILHVHEKISKFVHSPKWEAGVTQKGNSYISATYKHSDIRIYGKEYSHSFQLVVKEKGVRNYDFGDFISLRGKSTTEVKELAYIALRGTLSDSGEEIELLRKLYRDIKSNTLYPNKRGPINCFAAYGSVVGASCP